MAKSKTAVAKPKIKPYISEFTLRFDPMNIRGSMIGVRKSEPSIKPQWTLVSPDGNPVEQFYKDVETGNLFTSNQCDRKFESGGETTIVDVETLKAIKASDLPNNIMGLTVHPAEAVDNACYPDKGQGYLFYPDASDPANVALSAAFVAAIDSSPDKAFIGVCNFHGFEGLFRVETWRGRLVFQKQLYPNEVNDHDTVPVVVDNNTKMLKNFFDKKVQEFDPTTYRNATIEKQLKALEDPSTIESVKDKVEVPSEADISDLLASLENF